MSHPDLSAYNKPPDNKNNSKSEQQNAPNQENQAIARNPNPRANENIKNTPYNNEKNTSQQAGSEITDGEDG
jgi:hypothetical protein